MGVTIPHPVVFQLGTCPSPSAASLGTKQGDPCSPPSPMAKLHFSSFSAQVLWESSGCGQDAAGAAEHPKPQHTAPKLLQSQKNSPRICSHSQRSEASWHGPGRGERRDFLLQKNDLTFPPPCNVLPASPGTAGQLREGRRIHCSSEPWEVTASSPGWYLEVWGDGK